MPWHRTTAPHAHTAPQFARLRTHVISFILRRLIKFPHFRDRKPKTQEKLSVWSLKSSGCQSSNPNFVISICLLKICFTPCTHIDPTTQSLGDQAVLCGGRGLYAVPSRIRSEASGAHGATFSSTPQGGSDQRKDCVAFERRQLLLVKERDAPGVKSMARDRFQTSEI